MALSSIKIISFKVPLLIYYLLVQQLILSTFSFQKSKIQTNRLFSLSWSMELTKYHFLLGLRMHECGPGDIYSKETGCYCSMNSYFEQLPSIISSSQVILIVIWCCYKSNFIVHISRMLRLSQMTIFKLIIQLKATNYYIISDRKGIRVKKNT